MNDAELVLACVNIICNTVALVALAWIGGRVGTIEKRQKNGD